MPNIGIHGLHPREFAQGLKNRIDICMQNIGLGGDVITEIYDTDVKSCDGKKVQMPYLRIFSTELEVIYKIITAFSENDIFKDIEVISEKMMFFDSEDMRTGSWEDKWIEKIGKRKDQTLEIAMEILAWRFRQLGSERFMGELKAVVEDTEVSDEKMLKFFKALSEYMMTRKNSNHL